MPGRTIDHAFTARHNMGAASDPTYAGGLSFMRRRHTKNVAGADAIVWGIPFDAAVSNRPGARFGPVRALFADREWHEGQQDVILAAPFWRGGFYIHIDGPNAWDEKYVSEMVNTGLEFTTRIYRFLVRVSPTRYELRNYELQGRWKSVINMDATAQVTAQTPIHDLPHGMPIVSYPDTPISGFSPVLENFDRRHAEKVGDYQVGGGPHHDPAPLWPPPPGKE